jgi:hypothetical protein
MQRLEQFANNYQQTAEGVILNHSSDLADLQAQQLAKGITSQGKPILPLYSPYTVEYKLKYGKGLGRVVDHPTAFMTGETYKLLRAQVSAGKWFITADTFKFGKLEQHYGVRLFGLTRDSREDFRDNIALYELRKIYQETVIK